MIHPRSYTTGSTLVTRLVTHTLGTERQHPEDVIHTVLLHADGRCDYPKTYGGFKRREGTPKRVSIRTVRGTDGGRDVRHDRGPVRPDVARGGQGAPRG